MFATTDEEMQQIEQPMEFLMERNQNKCKRCTRFFSNEALLKQHHCEPPIKKEKRPHCGKVINRANNLRICEKGPTDPIKQQLRQMTLHGPTSSENGPLTSKKLMVEAGQKSGALTKHVEHWKVPETVESALKYTALTFSMMFNSKTKKTSFND